MKKIRACIVVALALLSTTSLFSQINIGIHHYRMGDIQKAKKYLEKELANNPSDANFYLGEIAFSEGNMQLAEEFYKKGLSANQENIRNQVGLIKLTLKTNIKEADNTLGAIVRKSNTTDAALTVARAYADNNMINKANDFIGRAKKINDKDPNIYILEGDIIVFESDAKKLGDAAAKYEMAIYFAPDYGLGYLKTADIYARINPSLAIENLKNIIEKQPEYIIAYSSLGKIYTQNGIYSQAIEMFKNYFQSGAYLIEDIELYARSLYFTDNYAEAKKMVDEGLQINPSHFVLNRYLMYIYAKTKDIDNGSAFADKFFLLREASGYIAQDYRMYAIILKNEKRHTESFINSEKAISIDPNMMESYTEAASAAREIKDYSRASDYLKRQMVKRAELSENPEYEDNTIDINSLGYDYYSAGATIEKNPSVAEEWMKNEKFINELLSTNPELIADSLKGNINYFTKNYATFFLNKADATFDILIQRVPESYLGYRFKALTKHALNPDAEQGAAKEFYEKTVEIITGKESVSNSETRVLLEAYNYLGYYYYLISDKPNTILYWNKVLEIDPENKNAKLVLDEMNK